MFVLRHCRLNMLVDRVSRVSFFSVNSRAGQLLEPLCLHQSNARYEKFKCHPYATFVEFKCWNCQTIPETKPSLFCKTCCLIQSTEQQNFNYFELLNISYQYDVDTEQLTSNFRKLQNLIHPDRFSNKTEEEKVLSESFSSLLNKAYTTLMNPLLRGLYMLNMRGLSIEEASVTMDSRFLGEIMEWNEQVEEADSKETLENIKKDVDIVIFNVYKELSKAFSENDLKQAKMLLSKAKYFSSLLEKIKEIDV